MLQNLKNEPFGAKCLVWEVLGFRFCILLRIFGVCFLCCCLDGLFALFWWSWAAKWGPIWNQFSQILQILYEKKRAEIGAQKFMTFGRLLGGAGGRGWGCGESYGLRPLPSAPDHCSLLCFKKTKHFGRRCIAKMRFRSRSWISHVQGPFLMISSCIGTNFHDFRCPGVWL